MSTISTTAPLRDLVLVQLPARETESAGGIIIPSTAREGAPDRGTVLRTGPDAREVSPGDVVFFRRGSGLPHPSDETCRILEEVEILAIHRERAEAPPEVADWVAETHYVEPRV